MRPIPEIATPLESKMISTNGIKLHVILAGPPDGKPLVLLHGFPEFWLAWRKQIDPLVNAGFRLIIPDQRGYNMSDKPADFRAYSISILAADIVGLLDSLQIPQASVAGHDWGAAVTWWLAIHHAERFTHAVVLNVPHGAVMKQALRSNRAQRKKSWYIFFFQLPFLAEWRLRAGHWKMAAASLSKTSRPGTFSEEDLDLYREAWSQPGAIRSMIHWYRAALRTKPKARSSSERVKIPLLMIWGARDRFLGRELVEPSLAYCDQPKLELIEEASHWVQHEEAGRVSGLLIDFFKPV